MSVMSARLHSATPTENILEANELGTPRYKMLFPVVSVTESFPLTAVISPALLGDTNMRSSLCVEIKLDGNHILC